jgi:hypothetical protein
LYWAVAYGHKDIVELLLAAGADPRVGCDHPPLCEAASNGRVDLVELLLAANADVNAQDKGYKSRTALHMVAMSGSKLIAELLLAAGADTEMKDEDGHTPRWVAEYHSNDHIAALLRQPAKYATNATRSFNKAGPSQVFPDFPLNPQSLFYQGLVIKDGHLLNIATIGLCICKEFDALKSSVGSEKWPRYADRELGALKRAYERMLAKVPPGTRHNVNTGEVRRLARAYLDCVKNSKTVYAEFTEARLTLLNMSIDFANTIACGGTLKTILEWYQ